MPERFPFAETIPPSGRIAMAVDQFLNDTNAVEAISRELGVERATAQAGAAALLPSILSGLQNPVAPAVTHAPAGEVAGDVAPGIADLGGLGGLLGSIGTLGGAGLLDNVTADAPTEVDKGNQILGQIFGSKDGSRAVAASAAADSGVEPSLLRKMLPILAMAAAGYVMKRAGQGGGLGGGALGGALGGILGDKSSGPSGQARPTQGGSVLDDLIGAAGKYLGR
jgi:hypothetical protein